MLTFYWKKYFQWFNFLFTRNENYIYIRTISENGWCKGSNNHFCSYSFVTSKRLYRDWYWVKGVRIWSYSGPNFPAFGLNTERYVSLCIQSECWKMRTRIIPNTDTFHAVWKLHKIFWGSKRKCEKSALNFYINRIFQESGVKKTKPISNLKGKDNCQY